MIELNCTRSRRIVADHLLNHSIEPMRRPAVVLEPAILNMMTSKVLEQLSALLISLDPMDPVLRLSRTCTQAVSEACAAPNHEALS